MLGSNHVTRVPVRQAVKVTRSALNHALDVAEPRLERVAGDLEDLSRNALLALRRSSRERLDDLKGGYQRIERRLRRQQPARASRKRLGAVALIAAGLAIVTIALVR